MAERSKDQERALGRRGPRRDEVRCCGAKNCGGRRAGPEKPSCAGGPSHAAPRPVPRGSDAPARRRRFGVVKVRDRQHVDMLLLAAATNGPANGYELIDLVRERSEGLFMLPVGIVYYHLHRLTNNRLMDRRARRYLLTPLGKRVLATRRREWEAFSYGFNRVLEAADDVDRS